MHTPKQEYMLQIQRPMQLAMPELGLRKEHVAILGPIEAGHLLVSRGAKHFSKVAERYQLLAQSHEWEAVAGHSVRNGNRMPLAKPSPLCQIGKQRGMDITNRMGPWSDGALDVTVLLANGACGVCIFGGRSSAVQGTHDSACQTAHCCAFCWSSI